MKTINWKKGIIIFIIILLIIFLFIWLNQRQEQITPLYKQNIELTLKNTELQKEIIQQANYIYKLKTEVTSNEIVIDSLKKIKNTIKIKYLPKYKELQQLPLQGQISELSENVKFCDISNEVSSQLYEDDTLLSIDWGSLYCINSTFLKETEFSEELIILNDIIKELELNENTLTNIITLQDTLINEQNEIIQNKDSIIMNQQKILKKSKLREKIKDITITVTGLGLLILVLISK